METSSESLLSNERYYDVVEGIQAALLYIEQSYEQPEDIENILPYHSAEHTLGVIGRTEMILRTIQQHTPELVTEEDIELAVLAAAYHDTVQDWKAVDIDSTVKRQRFAGKNEEASAALAISFMETINLRYGAEHFSAQDIANVKEAILATVPGWDAELGTVVQPNVTSSSSLIAHAVALADVNTAGMEGPEALLNDSTALFREDNLDILKAMQQPESLSNEQKGIFKTRMLAWLKAQGSFAKGRQQLLDAELQGIPDQARQAVKDLFSKFGDSINGMNTLTDACEQMTFEELAHTMGYGE